MMDIEDGESLKRIAGALERSNSNLTELYISIKALGNYLTNIAENLNLLEDTNAHLSAIGEVVKILSTCALTEQVKAMESLPVYNLERNVKLSIDAKLFKESRIANTEVGEAAVVIDDGFTRRTAIFDICTKQIEGSTLLRLSIEGEL